MMENKTINQLEQEGMHVVITTKDGKSIYKTPKTAKTIDDASKYCNHCGFLEFFPDPDPYDDFRDTDQKAYCNKYHKFIQRNLTVFECKRVHIPAFCEKADK